MFGKIDVKVFENGVPYEIFVDKDRAKELLTDPRRLVEKLD